MKNNSALLAVIVMAFLIFVPWLGDALFYTKGEPREAIVAMSMLQSGNWILPVNFGIDIPYKPPLLAWLIAVFSLIFNGGEVSEFTSRLPSALAAVALVVAFWRLVKSRYNENIAWTTALVLVTCFEFFRAAMACRVDMVLTACMVGGMMAIFAMRRFWSWRTLFAILLLSGAVLTKGPVGALLPCLVMAVYLLIEGHNFWRVALQLTTICLASFVLPAIWYYLAWQQGGDAFLGLALEENIGRLTGTMSYESHINPWYYNVFTILAGMLPWTVPALIAMCYRRIRRHFTWHNMRSLRGLDLFALTAVVVIFVFYCIPASKRSVYLLPCYPFLAYGVAALLMRITQTKLLRGYAVAISILSILAIPVAILCQQGVIKGVTAAGVHWWLGIPALIAANVGAWTLFSRRMRGNHLPSALLTTYLLVVAYNAAYMPIFVNPRSDVEAAQKVHEIVGSDPVYSVIEGDKLLRFYSIDFYCNDRLLTAPDSASVPVGAWCLMAIPKGASTPEGTMLITDRSSDSRSPVVLFKR